MPLIATTVSIPTPIRPFFADQHDAGLGGRNGSDSPLSASLMEARSAALPDGVATRRRLIDHDVASGAGEHAGGVAVPHAMSFRAAHTRRAACASLEQLLSGLNDCFAEKMNNGSLTDAACLPRAYIGYYKAGVVDSLTTLLTPSPLAVSMLKPDIARMVGEWAANGRLTDLLDVSRHLKVPLQDGRLRLPDLVTAMRAFRQTVRRWPLEDRPGAVVSNSLRRAAPALNVAPQICPAQMRQSGLAAALNACSCDIHLRVVVRENPSATRDLQSRMDAFNHKFPASIKSLYGGPLNSYWFDHHGMKENERSLPDKSRLLVQAQVASRMGLHKANTNGGLPIKGDDPFYSKNGQRILAHYDDLAALSALAKFRSEGPSKYGLAPLIAELHGTAKIVSEAKFDFAIQHLCRLYAGAKRATPEQSALNERIDDVLKKLLDPGLGDNLFLIAVGCSLS